MTRRRPEGRIRKAYSTRALMSLVVASDMATTIQKKPSCFAASVNTEVPTSEKAVT